MAKSKQAKQAKRALAAEMSARPSNEVLFEKSFEDGIFAVAFHPAKPEFAVGLATGHVHYYEYQINPGAQPVKVVEKWSTKRHKVSCRALSFDESGDVLYSCGGEGVIKRASSASGKVTAKKDIQVPATCIKVNESYVVVGDDEGTLWIFDLDLRLHRSYTQVHDECINGIIPIFYKNRHRFFTCGSTTISTIDARKADVVKTSEDQEDEILCGCLPSESYAAFGMSQGLITVWKTDFMEDQQYRIRISDQSVDCIIADEENEHLYAGSADGRVRRVNVRTSRILDEYVHSEHDEDEVTILELDYDYRLVTCSLATLKVWRKPDERQGEPEQKKPESKIEGAETDSKRQNTASHKKNAKKAKLISPGIASFDGL